MNKTFFRERPFHVKGTHWKNKTVKEKKQKWYLSDYKNGNFDMLFYDQNICIPVSSVRLCFLALLFHLGNLHIEW